VSELSEMKPLTKTKFSLHYLSQEQIFLLELTTRTINHRDQYHLCKPARQPDLLQRDPLIKYAVTTDDFYCQLVWDAEFHPQQLLNMADTRPHGTANKLGLQ